MIIENIDSFDRVIDNKGRRKVKIRTNEKFQKSVPERRQKREGKEQLENNI